MKLRAIIIYTLLTLGLVYTTVQAQTPPALVAIILPAGASVSVSCAASTLTVETTTATSRRLSCASTAGTPVATVPLPTITPNPTVTPMTMPGVTSWHPPGAHDGLNVHEHGSEPQSYFTAWSNEQFGIGIVYGGDESSGPMERDMKHQAYKGIAAKSVAGGDVYLRYHAASNPLDRSAQFHSYEIYYRDTSGNISFWQGLYDVGDSNTDARCPRRKPALDCEQQRPIILAVDQAAWNAGIRSEQWYARSSPESGVSWDMGINILNATTYYVPGENATATDETAWKLTGDRGLHRVGDGFWYLGRGHGGTDLTGWFCAEPMGEIVSAGSKTCPAGSLPQYIAATIGKDTRLEFGQRRISWLVDRIYSGTGANGPVTVPN